MGFECSLILAHAAQCASVSNQLLGILVRSVILATSLFLEVLEHMQRKYHIRNYQKEEYCFINLPINDLQQAAASLKELNFSILCTKRLTFTHQLLKSMRRSLDNPALASQPFPFRVFLP